MKQLRRVIRAAPFSSVRVAFWMGAIVSFLVSVTVDSNGEYPSLLDAWAVVLIVVGIVFFILTPLSKSDE